MYFIWWVKTNRLEPAVFPLAGAAATHESVLHSTMAMWAQHIRGGRWLSGRNTIKAKTVEVYVRAAAEITRVFDPLCRDPRQSGDRICREVASQLTDHRKYDTVPSRVRPYTLQMHKLLLRDAESTSPDSLTRALAQWLGATLMGGNRRVEWAQPKQYAKSGCFQQNPNKDCYAFTIDDICFYSSGSHRLPLEQALRARENVARVGVTYRWQKNQSNGEVKYYNLNSVNPANCAVSCYLAICERWKRLRGSAKGLPLAIYATGRGTIVQITEADISRVIRDLASRVYDMPLSETAGQWTSHSVRVGACVLLWSKGYSGEFIQRALRWQGDSWRDYVREVPQHADMHNEAINAMMDAPVW